MHRPSAEKEWQHPAAMVDPIPLRRRPRSSPLEVQAASYLAASARIVSLSMSSKETIPLEIELSFDYLHLIIEQMFCQEA